MISKAWNSLAHMAQLFSVGPCRDIVIRPHRLQSPFYKTLEAPLSVPPANYKHSGRWDNPNYVYPPPTVAPTKKTGQSLIVQVEKEERDRLTGKKLAVPNIRSGDVLQFGYYRSISSKKILNLEGVVMQTRNRRSLRATAKVLMNYHMCETRMDVRLYSPMVTYIRISKYGAGNLRKRLGYLEDGGVTESMSKQPVVKKADVHKRIPKPQKKGSRAPKSQPVPAAAAKKA